MTIRSLSLLAAFVPKYRERLVAYIEKQRLRRLLTIDKVKTEMCINYNRPLTSEDLQEAFQQVARYTSHM